MATLLPVFFASAAGLLLPQGRGHRGRSCPHDSCRPAPPLPVHGRPGPSPALLLGSGAAGLHHGHRRGQGLTFRLGSQAAHAVGDNRFWESCSPDEETVASPMRYIWDGILARIIVELDEER